MSIPSSTVAVGLPTDSQSVGLQAQQATHAMEAATVATSFEVDPASGLSSAEVAQRRTRYGTNELQTAHSRAAWCILLDQFKSLVVALLAVAAVVAWLTGDVVEAIAILVVLGLNALIGFVTEWQAGRALNAISIYTSLQALCLQQRPCRRKCRKSFAINTGDDLCRY